MDFQKLTGLTEEEVNDRLVFLLNQRDKIRQWSFDHHISPGKVFLVWVNQKSSNQGQLHQTLTRSLDLIAYIMRLLTSEERSVVANELIELYPDEESEGIMAWIANADAPTRAIAATIALKLGKEKGNDT